MTAATQMAADGEPGVCAGVRPRLGSVDLLRGIAMVVMALDHVRDYFSNAHIDTTDLADTTPELFLTRWITHFCAPIFIFLAGTSAFLSRGRGKTDAELSRFLLTRGIWLVVLEVTVVRLGWAFNFDFSMVALQVIWAIGMSMVVLSALVFLSVRSVTAIGITLILAHNLFDRVAAESFGSFAWLWYVLHVPHMPVIYPLVPWVGVMAAGYGLGSVFGLEPARQRRILLTLGLTLIIAFVMLRAVNLYGDPRPWSTQATGTMTVLSFLNVTKYPPSLLFLLMTLGPAIAALPLLEDASGPVARFVTVYGRVPLFFYVVHLYVIHALAIGAAYLTGHDTQAFFSAFFAFPKSYGFGLPGVYLIWFAVVAMLYPACSWFAGVKQRRRDWWLSYL